MENKPEKYINDNEETKLQNSNESISSLISSQNSSLSSLKEITSTYIISKNLYVYSEEIERFHQFNLYDQRLFTVQTNKG